MLTRDLFEKLALGAATASYSFATESFGDEEAPTVDAMAKATAEGFEDEARELAMAFDRLGANPSLRSSDQNGVFTYEDPILANAALHAREQFAALPESHRFKPGEELTSYAQWMLMGVRSFLARHRYDPRLPSLASQVPKEPLRLSSEPLRIAVVGDAGQAGYCQDRVIKMMLARQKERPFDAVIHLGDVYFAAGIKQMVNNFLFPFSALRNSGCPVFTLCGNHDLYYGAEAYHHALSILGQPGRYFCIENDEWRIVCLDTSLGAVTFLRNDGQLDDGQLRWLRNLLDINDGKRLVFMSHHFIVSGWDSPAATLQHLLADEVRGKLFAWYWGHEHRAAAYERGEHGFFGASLGNGAFPEVWSSPSRNPAPAWFSSSRCTCFGESHYWPHGYAELEFRRGVLSEVIHLENGERLESVLTDQGSQRRPIPPPGAATATNQ